MHWILNLWYSVLDLANELESYLISSGLSRRYRAVDVSKVQCLAVVVDSDEALQTWKVFQILQWLAAIGLRNVCLYDKEGIVASCKITMITIIFIAVVVIA